MLQALVTCTGIRGTGHTLHCVTRTVCVCTVAVCLKFALLFLQLRSGGSQILEGCIAEIPNISSLDISDNGERATSMHIVLSFYRAFQL